MAKLELVAGEKKIEFIVDEKAWCNLYFIEHDNINKLGAHCLGEIISKLLIAFISIKNRKYFTYKQETMFTIISLMEPHTVITGRETDELGLEMSYIDKEGNILPLINLTTVDMEKWVKEMVLFILECGEKCRHDM